MDNVIVVEGIDIKEFQDECDNLMTLDYKISSSSCGYYGAPGQEGPVYIAIMVNDGE